MCIYCGRFVNTSKPIPFQYGCGLESEQSTAQKCTDHFAKLGPPFNAVVADPPPLTPKEIRGMLALGDRGRNPKTVVLKMASLQPAQDAAKAAPKEISPLPSNTDDKEVWRKYMHEVISPRLRHRFAADETCKARCAHILRQQIDFRMKVKAMYKLAFHVARRRRKSRVSDKGGTVYLSVLDFHTQDFKTHHVAVRAGPCI